MKLTDIRKQFLDFFKAKGHAVVKSDSLVPQNDPTLLFTGAGMNQFKDYFLGLRSDLKRAASSQKCLRTGDLDEVGKTPYHHSFFEMLGNFSFGDYFKEEAIVWAWQFLTQEMGIAKEKLFVSVHEKDNEALQIWSKKIGIPENLIARLGDKSNFWPSDAPKVGPNGPCGPCSEIFFDQGSNYPGATKRFWADDESGRFAEIWNLVFTQFERQEGGELIPLKAKNIDTGMGLERLACVMQGKRNNFETDAFQSINKAVKLTLGLGERAIFSIEHIYAISDHIRAIVFAITDGVIPSNEGRGYVIRKLIRRALWRGHELLNPPERSAEQQREQPFLYQVAPHVVAVMQDAYPNLSEAAGSIKTTILSEEERFLSALETGLEILNRRITSLKNKKVLPGEMVFQLYDTYGFPDELTKKIANERGLKIDQKGFDHLMEDQRKRAKASSKLADTIFAASDINQELLKLPETKFVGYQALETEGKILWLNVSKDQGAIVLDQTPFYPEGGGQVGDTGMLEGKKFTFSVSDTQKKERVIVHYGKLMKGKPEPGDACQANVNKELREATKRNHTATHLLQAALRAILGTHVRQVGSLVNPEKLRFDFTHGKALVEHEIKKVENWVNEAVLASTAVQAGYQTYDTAIRNGVLAFFGDKYADEVRVIEVPGRSKELCGGTHCRQTGEIGAFVITSESSVGSGVRRIEAITGMNAIRHLKKLEKTLNRISSLLKVNPDQIVERVEKLRTKIKEFERTGKTAPKGTTETFDFESLIRSAKSIGGINLISKTIQNEDFDVLRELADRLRTQTKQSVVALFSTKDSKVNLIIALTKDLMNSQLDAQKMAQAIVPFLEGSAGGRKDLAQGGGRNAKKIDEALDALSKLIQQAAG